MGKSAPAPPPAPDYLGAAKEQGAANLTAATQTSVLGNPNVSSPLGGQNVNYNNITGPDGQTYLQPTISQYLTPDAQKALSDQQAVKSGLAGLAQTGLSQAQSILGQQFNPNLQPLTTQVQDLGQANGSLGMFGQQQTDLGGYQQANGQLGPTGRIQNNIDTRGVPQMPISPGMTAQQAILARLNPQITQNNQALQQQLANQGLTAGGEAYNNAMRVQGQQNNDLVSQAALQGIGLDLSANQQAYGQAANSANFANTAQQQRYNEALGGAQLGNQAAAQNYAQQLGAAQFANQGQNQNFAQQLQAQQFGNQSLAQNYQQQLQNAQFGNQATQQSLQQQLGLYDQPLNQITALMSGSQIQMPQFQGYQGANVGAAPIANAYTQQGQYAQNNYAQQVANINSQNALLGDLFGAVGGAAGAYFGA